MAAFAHIFLFMMALADDFQDGLRAMQQNDWKAASAHLQAAAKTSPANARIWLALARTQSKLGLAAEAKASAAKAANLGSRDGLVQKSLVVHYTEAGEPLDAARAQARYAALTTEDDAREQAAAMYFALVQPLLAQQKFTEAGELLREARKACPGNAQLELAMGVALYGTRHFDEAAGAFLETIRIAPEVEQSYVFLGKFLDQVQARRPEIAKAFAAYTAKFPERDTGYLLQAKLLNAQSAEPERARQLLDQALSRNNANPATYFELGVLLFQLRDYAGAARAWERCAALEPRNATVHYRLSLVYRRLGKHEAAEAERALHGKLEKDVEAGKYPQQP